MTHPRDNTLFPAGAAASGRSVEHVVMLEPMTQREVMFVAQDFDGEHERIVEQRKAMREFHASPGMAKWLL